MRYSKFFLPILALGLGLTGCAGADAAANESSEEAVTVLADENGFAEGGVDDTMHTEFFDFIVSDPYLCTSYGSYAAAEGEQLLVLTIKIKNTTDDVITMYDTDFQVQWEEDGGDLDAYEYPITFELPDGEKLSSEMLMSEYKVRGKRFRDGTLIYNVPADKSKFSLSYKELFADGTSGDSFFVYFVPDILTSAPVETAE